MRVRGYMIQDQHNEYLFYADEAGRVWTRVATRPNMWFNEPDSRWSQSVLTSIPDRAEYIGAYDVE